MSNKFVTTIEDHRAGKHKHIRDQKFVTTKSQHKARKARYNLRHGFPHRKSAIDSNWWQERLARDPYLYHKTAKDNVENILKDGMYPFDAAENPNGTQYQDDQYLHPRPNHVYLADQAKIQRIAHDSEDPQTLRVDMRKLDPSRLNADEDSYVFNGPPAYDPAYDEFDEGDKWKSPGQPAWHPTAGKVMSQRAHAELGQNFGHYPWSPEREAWLKTQGVHPDAANATTVARAAMQQYLHQNVRPTWNSYGEWANDQLNDPAHTQWSIARNGTLAHNGHIPPEAISFEAFPNKEDGWRNPYAKVAVIDQGWLNKWMEENGPYLYHGAGDEQAVNSILGEGLYPHDVAKPNEPRGIPSRSGWGGDYLEPRAGHVYMGNARKAAGYVGHEGNIMAVDLRKLDPSKITADEDAFGEDVAKHYYQRADDQDHPVNKIWDFDPPPTEQGWMNGEDENLGQWANRVGVGDHDPNETHHSLSNFGSVAYKGVVPPEAISISDPQDAAFWNEPQKVPYDYREQPEEEPWWTGMPGTENNPLAPKAAGLRNELHVGLDVPRAAGKAIHDWAHQQNWPEGTELEHPKDYHVTLLYTPEGHEHQNAYWMEHLDHAHAKVNGIDSFPSQENGGYALVLRVESPGISEHAEMLQDRAERNGLPITRFPGGYKPHITIGYSPTEAPSGLQTPDISFDLGPSKVSPRRYKEDEPEVKESASQEEVDLVHNLSMQNVAHNLHYRCEKGETPEGMVDYTHRLLKLVGYPQDDITTKAALEAWQSLYPGDKVLDDQTAPPEQAMTPTESWGYGTVSSKEGMAADPYWLDDWIKRNGPYLYHETKPQNRQSILNNGLLPWDHPYNPSNPTDEGFLQPRPGHTYMRNLDPHYVQERWDDPNADRVAVPIDVRKLDPSKMNPDEDAFMQREQRMWNLPDPDDAWASSDNLGEWGAKHLHTPAQTAWSLESPMNDIRGGTMSYNGQIPPEAIAHPHVKTWEEHPEWQSDPEHLGKIADAPSEPPNLREGDIHKHCGNCKMFNNGKCWGYGNKQVDEMEVCDSWDASEDKAESTEPTAVNNPTDHWPDHGDRSNEDRSHQVQIGNDK